MEEPSENHKPYQSDVLIFLVLIPLISAFNYYLTYSNIQFNGFLLLTFTIDTVQGYLAWLGVRHFIFYLDEKWPYEQGPVKRILFQLASTTFIGLFIISLLTEMVSLLARGEMAPLHFYTVDLFIISIWFLVMNGIYIGLYYYHRWQEAESRYQREERLESEGIVVTQGKKDIMLKFENLDGFYVDGNYVVACDQNAKKYYLDQQMSLSRLEEILPAHLFYRPNRQCILHRSVIRGYKRAGNGKIEILPDASFSLSGHFPMSISRTKAPSFKVWFQT